MAGQTFCDIARLPPERLRQLISSTVPTERIFAAWALGLTQQNSAAPYLTGAMDREPDAGVRRHLIVVLAGLGERDAVCVLAEYDPDEHVRATAVRQLLRLARPQDADLHALLVRCVQRDKPTVCIACIEEVKPDSPQQLLDAIEPLIVHPDAAVRAAVIERLARGRLFSRPLPALATDVLVGETDLTLQDRIIEILLRREGPLTLAIVLSDRRIVPRLQGIFERLIEHREELSWPAISVLVSCAPAAARKLLPQLLSRKDAGPARLWLLTWFVETQQVRHPERPFRTFLAERVTQGYRQNEEPLSPRELQLRDELLDRHKARLLVNGVMPAALGFDTRCPEADRWCLLEEKWLLAAMGITTVQIQPIPKPRPMARAHDFEEYAPDAVKADADDRLLPADMNFDDLDACVAWWIESEERGNFHEELQDQMLHVQKDVREFLRRLQLAKQKRAAALRC